MSGHKFVIIDPAAGISGDMLLGALIDAGAPRSWLTGLPERLGLPGVTVEIGAAVRCGVRSTSVTVRAPDGSVELPGDLHAHGHGPEDRKSTRLNSSHGSISYAVFCLKKKKTRA